MYLVHAVVLKLLIFTLTGTAAFFVCVGLPGWLTYVTFAAEAVGAVLLILRIQSRWVTLALLPALFWQSCGSTVQMAGSSPLPAVVGSILRS